MLTPKSDDSCKNLALYLQQELNAAYTEAQVVATVRDYNGFSGLVADFPLLTVYRTGSNGSALQNSDGVVAYYLPSLTAQEQTPGILNWVEKNIAALLGSYGQVNRCIQIELGSLRSEQRIGRVPDSAIAFPFLKIYFKFLDYDI